MDLDQMCGELEKEELENGEESSTELYAQLLAIYLNKNEICSARFLWKRIPQNIKSNTELEVLWSIGQKLWKKDIAGCYASISSFNWNEPVLSIMKSLEQKIRDSAFSLISKAYSTISVDSVSTMCGLSGDALRQACSDRHWELTNDGTTFKPVPEEKTSQVITTSEDQMYKLTEFVCFLEN